MNADIYKREPMECMCGYTRVQTHTGIIQCVPFLCFPLQLHRTKLQAIPPLYLVQRERVLVLVPNRHGPGARSCTQNARYVK